MGFSTNFRNWRATAMAILANDNTNVSISLAEFETENIHKNGASKYKAEHINFNLKSKLLRKAVA
jgi:hypothetical protein